MSVFYISAKEVYSPEAETSPAPSTDTAKTSRVNSFEIENLLKVSIILY